MDSLIITFTTRSLWWWMRFGKYWDLFPLVQLNLQRFTAALQQSTCRAPLRLCCDQDPETIELLPPWRCCLSSCSSACWRSQSDGAKTDHRLSSHFSAARENHKDDQWQGATLAEPHQLFCLTSLWESGHNPQSSYTKTRWIIPTMPGPDAASFRIVMTQRGARCCCSWISNVRSHDLNNQTVFCPAQVLLLRLHGNTCVCVAKPVCRCVRGV